MNFLVPEYSSTDNGQKSKKYGNILFSKTGKLNIKSRKTEVNNLKTLLFLYFNKILKKKAIPIILA